MFGESAKTLKLDKGKNGIRGHGLENATIFDAAFIWIITKKNMLIARNWHCCILKNGWHIKNGGKLINEEPCQLTRDKISSKI